MKEKKEGSDITSYILGILSIVASFFLPLMGLIIGLIGVYQAKRQENDLSKRGKKLSIIGIILSIIFLVLYIVANIYLNLNGIGNLTQNFPTG